MKIVQVITQEPIDIRALTPLTYYHSKAEFIEEGIKLPTIEDLKLTNDSNWWILLSDIQCHIKIQEDDGTIKWLNYKMKRGLVTDLLSVPKFFRSIVDDNNQAALYAGYCHDMNFSFHFRSFRDSNKIFKAMIEHGGENKIKALIYFLAVSTPIGKMLYNQKTILRSPWQMDFVEFTQEQ